MKNLPNYNDGDTMPAADFDTIPNELENVITTTGIALSGSDVFQIAKSIANMLAAGDFYADTGAANSYVLSAISLRKTPTAYVDGFRCRFRVGNTNTGSSTINVATLGVKSIKKSDGITDPSPGDLPAGEITELAFDANNNVFVLFSHKDQTAIFTTGDSKFTLKATADPDWIMYTADGTIGSATSSATIRANADCQDLFEFLWDTFSDSQCSVDTGRGGSAAADWAANKRIHVPIIYGRVLAAPDATYPAATTTGEINHALTPAENAAHNHGISPTESSVINAGALGSLTFGPGGYQDAELAILNSGSGTGHNNMQPTYFMNVMIKL